MKFQQLQLNESIFDSTYVGFKGSNSMDNVPFDFDDDFSTDDYNELTDIPSTPKPGTSSGIADTLINLINDEWEAIQGYNNAVEQFEYMIRDMSDHNAPKMIGVLKDIVNEENKHVGQLQEILKLVSPNAESIEVGHEEGSRQIRDVTPMLQGIQFWDDNNSEQPKAGNNAEINNSNPNNVSTVCDLCNVDDDM